MKSLIFLIAISIVSGCSVLSFVAENENQLAVQYGTLKVLERDDVSSDRIIQLVTDAKRYVQEGASVSVTALASAARDYLRSSSLTPADMILIEAILSRAEARLKEQIGSGLLTGEQRVQLLTVLNWIEDAARGKVISS